MNVNSIRTKRLLIAIVLLVPLSLFSVTFVKKIRNSMRRATAHCTCTQINNALLGFEHEYGYFPIQEESEGPFHSTRDILDVLMARDTPAATALNVRRVSFYEASPSTRRGKCGFRSDTGELRDPWGNLFVLYLDTDGDGRVTYPEPYRHSKAERLPRTVLVCTAGPDGLLETVNDNLTSWE